MPPIPGCCPGGTVGAGGATTPGVNRLPPVGLMVFSVGAGAAGALLLGGAEVVAVVVGVVVLDGACFPLLPHPAVSVPSPINAAPAATATMRRPKREFIDSIPVCCAASYCGERQEVLSEPEARAPSA